MIDTLNLDDELEDDLESCLEGVFSLKCSEHAERVQTVGDIVQIVRHRFAGQIDLPGACMTSMAFYRLRRAAGSRRKIRPTTPLAEIDRGWPAHLLRRLSRLSGLRVSAEFGGLHWFAVLVVIFALFLGATGVVTLDLGRFEIIAAAAIVGAIGAFLMWLDPGSRGNLLTFGDLARQAVSNNYATLAQEGGAVRGDELRSHVVEILALVANVPACEIADETRLRPLEEAAARAA